MSNKSSAFMKAAARQVAGLVGENDNNRRPILIVIGDQSPAAIVDFQNAVLHTLDVCERIRNFHGLPQLRSYLDRSSVRDPVYYAEPSEAPSHDMQKEVVRLFNDDQKRHFMPLLLTAVHRHPSAYGLARARTPVLLPEFLKLVGDRIVDITPQAASGHIPIETRMVRLFQAVVARNTEIQVEPEATELVAKAVRSTPNGTEDLVMRLATRAKALVKERKLPTVTRDLVWELLPPPFRESLPPSGAAAS